MKFFENLVSFKPPKGMGTITAENFVTSATTAGLLRKDGESAYLTIGDNTLRVSHHNTSVETFEKHWEADNNILSIVFEKRDAKPFKGKDSVNAVEYVYKTEDLTGVKAALVWYDISTFLKTGIYTDHVGANYVHYSGSVEFKEAAKKKVEADKQAMFTIERFNPEKNDIRFSLTGDLDLGDTSLSPEDYRRSIDPLFDFVMEYTDGIVNPGPEHIGEDFDGFYISEAYNKFSTKRKQGKKESVI